MIGNGFDLGCAWNMAPAQTKTHARSICQHVAAQYHVNSTTTPTPAEVHATMTTHQHSPLSTGQDYDANILGEVHVSTFWAARIEGISEHHARRLARAGHYQGAFRRGGTGEWLIPLSGVVRTLDGTIQHWLHQDTEGWPDYSSMGTFSGTDRGSQDR